MRPKRADPTGSGADPTAPSAGRDAADTGPIPRADPLPSRTSLTFRVVLLVVGVAFAVAAIAGVVGTALVRTTALDVAQDYLRSQADVISGELNGDEAGTRLGFVRLIDIFRQQNIAVIYVTATGTVSGKDVDAVKAATNAGLLTLNAKHDSFSEVVTVSGRKALVEGRFADGRAFALVTRVDNGAVGATSLQGRVLLALAIGLAVALVGGFVVARLMSRPLKKTAHVARAMGAGARDLRVTPAGPQEVAEVARAVNELADALQHSESRQKDFLTSVSHELRTPLTAIAGQAEALSDGIVPPVEVRAVGATIAAESARMQRLVADLLDLARLGADQFRLELAPCDVTSLIADMAMVWRVRCEQRGVALLVERPDHPVVVTTDARRLRQVLDGLAENALRLLPPGAPLVLSVDGEPGDWIRLQVRDGGPGLTTEDYPVAFERGVLHDRYRGRRPTGAGLGLALIHSLITRMGGRIAAAPAREGGVAMTIDLPPRSVRESDTVSA